MPGSSSGVKKQGNALFHGRKSEGIHVKEGVHSMFLRKKNLKFFCCSFEKNVFLRMCIQQQMRMFSMSH